MSTPDPESKDELLEQKLRIQQQITFASGLFQGDITVRTLLESIGEGIVIIDKFGTILLVNTRAEQMFGYPREEIVGKAHEILLPERFRTVHEQHTAHYFEEPRARPMGLGLDLSGRRRDGSEFPVEISLTFLETINGLLVLAFISDISHRKEAENKLRKSEYLLAEAQRLARIGSFEYDPIARQITGSEEMFRIFGRTFSAYETFLELVHPEDRNKVNKAVQDALDRETPYTLLYRIIRPDGINLIVHSLREAVTDDTGNVVRMIGTVQDVTEQKLLEEKLETLNSILSKRAGELESANLRLEAFSYTVAHDLRNPLNVINGYCQLLQQSCSDKLDEKCNGYIKNTHEGALQMTRLIEALLEFSRLDRVEPLRETVDLSTLAREAAAELKQAEPGRRAVFRIAEGISVNGDASLLRVAMNNLLGNAWKFTSSREEAVIEVGVEEINGESAFFVRDNGAGFDMAYAEKLFIPFQRLPGLDLDKYKGHGIGLATVERIIKRHGGRVWAEGELDKGATFYFTLQH